MCLLFLFRRFLLRSPLLFYSRFCLFLRCWLGDDSFLFRLLLFFRFGLNFNGFFHSFLKSINLAGGVNQFLFAGVKRMAGAANLDLHFRLGRTNSYNITASADNFSFRIIFWVNVFLHVDMMLIR